MLFWFCFFCFGTEPQQVIATRQEVHDENLANAATPAQKLTAIDSGYPNLVKYSTRIARKPKYASRSADSHTKMARMTFRQMIELFFCLR